MAVPKKRTSASQRNQRRSHHALEAAAVTKCSNCGADVKPHNACLACGFYNGKKIAKVA